MKGKFHKTSMVMSQLFSFFHIAVYVSIDTNFYIISNLYTWLHIHNNYLHTLPWNDLLFYGIRGSRKQGNKDGHKQVSYQEKSSNAVV